MITRVRVFVGLLLGVVVSSCSYLDVKQRELIFRPVKADRPGYESVVGGVQELWLSVPAGMPGDAASAERGPEQSLHAWWWPVAADAPTVLYLHGTRWNLTGSAWRIARLRRLGFNVLAIDYRGFGRSSGDLPSEQQTYEDALAGWAHLRALEPDPAKRFVYGHSLGGAVAIELATRVDDVAGLIVESTFTSMREMAATTWARILPIGLILTQHYDSAAKIARLDKPILFVHGKADRFVPYAMSEQLYAATRAPKRLLLVEGGGHSDSAGQAFEAFASAVADLRRLAAVAPAPARVSAFQAL